MSDEGLAQRWCEYAQRDLESAVYLQGMHPKPIEVICYLSQQSAEKYLKGYLIALGQELVKTHDLVYLLSLIIPYNPSFETLFPHCQYLKVFAVKVRYPDEIELFDTDAIAPLVKPCILV